MKKLLQSSWMQWLIATLISTYLKFCYGTTRWQDEGLDEIEKVWESKKPVVAMFWHERLHMGYATWPIERGQKIAVLSSTSKFGDVQTRITTTFGRHTIRGSSAKKSDPGKDKRGAPAFRDMLRWLKDGNGVCTTPDGPRGPARIMTGGTILLSQMSGGTLVFLGQSTKRYIQLKSWDNMRLPLPFSTAASVWRVLPPPPRDADEAAMEQYRLLAQETLDAATDRADDLIGVPHGQRGGRQVPHGERHTCDAPAELAEETQ